MNWFDWLFVAFLGTAASCHILLAIIKIIETVRTEDED